MLCFMDVYLALVAILYIQYSNTVNLSLYMYIQDIICTVAMGQFTLGDSYGLVDGVDKGNDHISSEACVVWLESRDTSTLPAKLLE